MAFLHLPCTCKQKVHYAYVKDPPTSFISGKTSDWSTLIPHVNAAWLFRWQSLTSVGKICAGLLCKSCCCLGALGLKRNRARWFILTFLKPEEEKLSVDSKALSLGWPICQHPQEASGLHSLLISNLKATKPTSVYWAYTQPPTLRTSAFPTAWVAPGPRWNV